MRNYKGLSQHLPGDAGSIFKNGCEGKCFQLWGIERQMRNYILEEINMSIFATVLYVVILAFLAWQIWGSVWNILAIVLELFRS